MEINPQNYQNAPEPKITPLPGSEEISRNGEFWQYKGYKVWEGNAYFIYSPPVSGRTGFRRKCWIIQRPNRSRWILNCQPEDVERRIDGDLNNGSNGNSNQNHQNHQNHQDYQPVYSSQPKQECVEFVEVIEEPKEPKEIQEMPEGTIGTMRGNNRPTIRRGFGRTYHGNIDKKEGDNNENDGYVPKM